MQYWEICLYTEYKRYGQHIQKYRTKNLVLKAKHSGEHAVNRDKQNKPTSDD